MSATFIPVANSRVRAVIHTPQVSPPRFATIMCAGAGGGLTGPGGIYADLGRSCASLGGIGLQMDYRRPAQLRDCVEDVLAAVNHVNKQYDASIFFLVGWSFGGAVVIDAGARSGQVRGVCTVASQTAGTERVSRLAPKALLLLHGTGDTCLPPRCSQRLYAMAEEPKQLILYDGDNHGLTNNSASVLSTIASWIQQTLGAQAR